MPANEPSIRMLQFLGLRNRDNPARLPPGSLSLAKNIDIDNTFGIGRRRGYAALGYLTAVTAAYATQDARDLYVVNDGTLHRVVSLSPLAMVTMATGIPPGEVWWADSGGYVFCSGAISGVIHGDAFYPYAGFGSVDSTTLELTVGGEDYEIERDEADIGTSGPPPDTECVGFFEGSVWLSYFDPGADQSFIFKSKPFFWSRWDLATDYIAVPGRVLMLCGLKSGMVIGTDREIWAYGAEGLLQRLADYGSVAGQAGIDDGRAYFWTTRGLCRALPFEEITDANVSLPAGARSCVGVLRQHGTKRAIIVTTGGGKADNAYE